MEPKSESNSELIRSSSKKVIFSSLQMIFRQVVELWFLRIFSDIKLNRKISIERNKIRFTYSKNFFPFHSFSQIEFTLCLPSILRVAISVHIQIGGFRAIYEFPRVLLLSDLLGFHSMIFHFHCIVNCELRRDNFLQRISNSLR